MEQKPVAADNNNEQAKDTKNEEHDEQAKDTKNDEHDEQAEDTKNGEPDEKRAKDTKNDEHPEQQYLNLIRQILAKGKTRIDRTCVGTISIFGAQMRYDLRKEFPLFTTKRVFWRAVVEELLWFIHGKTDAKLLHEKNVHIWDKNGTRTFLDKLGLTDRAEGDLGPIYGFQWRHFGAKYKTCDDDYTNQGIDQLSQVIHQIKTNPNDRRIVMSAWNPIDLPKMALPPCHCFVQFYVADNELSCQLYQRSADMGLGVPFNVASYALLTHLIANITNLKPGDLIHSLGDTHIYLNHVDGLKIQLKRTPTPLPTVRLRRKLEKIEDFVSDDIILENYDPYPAIRLDMAV